LVGQANRGILEILLGRNIKGSGLLLDKEKVEKYNYLISFLSRKNIYGRGGVNQMSKKFIEEAWFNDSPEGVVLMGSRCRDCGKVSFPKKKVCPDCFNGELSEVPLSKKGRLHSYALSLMGPPGVEAPYVMAFIDLPEKIKLYSILTDCEPRDEILKIGMEMEMVIEKIGQDPEGNEIMGYKFKPVKKE